MAQTLPAPWRAKLTEQITKRPGQEFALATVANGTGSGSNSGPVPRVRECAFRGFFPNTSSVRDDVKKMIQQEFDLPYTLKSPIFGDVESDLISFTTDERMDKVDQMNTSGGAVEALFYLRDISTQWRIKGRGCIFGAPGGEEGAGGSGQEQFREQEARREIGRRLRWKDLSSTSDWNGDGDGHLQFGWEKAVTVYFANQTPVLRGNMKVNVVIWLAFPLLTLTYRFI